jgi:hypothetical protein
LFVALASALILAPLSAAAAPTAAPSPAATAASPFVGIPVTGTIGSGGTFVGTLNIQRFAQQDSNLVAIGTLTGTLTDALGNVIGTVTNVPVRLPVGVAQSTCTILDLTLGPLDLNLLGLMVHLNQVHLTITAQQGPGNLLGNLLCAIANLLNDGNPLSDIVGLLNQILRIFG